jgi:hypothetical protein
MFLEQARWKTNAILRRSNAAVSYQKCPPIPRGHLFSAHDYHHLPNTLRPDGSNQTLTNVPHSFRARKASALTSCPPCEGSLIRWRLSARGHRSPFWAISNSCPNKTMAYGHLSITDLLSVGYSLGLILLVSMHLGLDPFMVDRVPKSFRFSRVKALSHSRRKCL